MSCWNVLALAPGADTRTIKRQYAALLKKTRPDDDPEGFQRLREAYEEALNWGERQQEVDPLATVEHAPTDIIAKTLQQQYQKALASGAGLLFEITLLQRIVDTHEVTDDDLQWAFETFKWLSAWQRLELPDALIASLETQSRAALQTPMSLALEQKDEAGFLAAYKARLHQPWMDKSLNAQLFNTWLAKLLLDSHYWSAAVFEAVCAGQGWHGGSDHTCPPQDWPLLLRRQQRPQFIARQRELAAEAPGTPQQRAARLLLAPMTLGQRRAFAQRLDENDWAACRRLSGEIYAEHPVVAASMPGGTPYFWLAWERTFDSWPLVLATVVGCMAGALVHAESLTGNLLRTLGIGLLWSIVIVMSGFVGWHAWRPLAHKYRVLDEHLSTLLPRWLSPTRLPLLPLRDLLPGAAMIVAAGYKIGPAASMTLLFMLAVIGLFKRHTLKTHTPWTPGKVQWPTHMIVLSIASCVVLYGGLKMLDSQHQVNRNQGLQQWTERLCSRLPANAQECQIPATEAQWYGQEAKR
ncbi:J domain-containing protein [Pseudomonas viridiflava]|uniref:J domain-containing protein n=1 Tax=Pseudomonas viridiflava TaxID=33069 RepID=UPI00130389E0|nr:J domain-containing protein [Pseudomonas viridiflava]MEE4104807.1 J domain-containing protein [Pseudomonas viridiflava]